MILKNRFHLYCLNYILCLRNLENLDSKCKLLNLVKPVRNNKELLFYYQTKLYLAVYISHAVVWVEGRSVGVFECTKAASKYKYYNLLFEEY